MTATNIVHHRREAGFSLAETLIAVAIIAGVTAMAFDTIGQDARIARQMHARREAAAIAQSELARAVVGDGAESGVQGDFAWRVARAPYRAQGIDEEGRLERVAVQVSDVARRRPLVTLQTLTVRP